MSKEAIELGLEKPRKISFYDRHIRQKKIRLDMIICVFLMVLIQVGIYFVVRYMTTPKYNSNNVEYNDFSNDNHPYASMYSYVRK